MQPSYLPSYVVVICILHMKVLHSKSSWHDDTHIDNFYIIYQMLSNLATSPSKLYNQELFYNSPNTQFLRLIQYFSALENWS